MAVRSAFDACMFAIVLSWFVYLCICHGLYVYASCHGLCISAFVMVCVFMHFSGSCQHGRKGRAAGKYMLRLQFFFFIFPYFILVHPFVARFASSRALS